MDIQNLSMNMAQGRIQEEAAVRVQSMALDTARERSEDLTRLMNSTQVMRDPARGNNLDMFM